MVNKPRVIFLCATFTKYTNWQEKEGNSGYRGIVISDGQNIYHGTVAVKLIEIAHEYMEP